MIRYESSIEQGFWTGVMSSLSIDFVGLTTNATRWTNPWDALTQHRMMRHAMGMGFGVGWIMVLLSGLLGFIAAGWPEVSCGCVITLLASQAASIILWLRTSTPTTP